MATPLVMNSLANQVAAVTGAGSGIGRAVALALAVQGATVALVGRRLAPLAAVAEEVRGLGADARALQAELSEEAGVRGVAAALGRDFSRLDVLVLNAAVHGALAGVADARTEDFDLLYRTNVRSPYLLTQLLLPQLVANRGQVVFINSSAGLTARAGVGQFSATKHALKALADSLRDEVNRDGVRVLSVYPGRTASPNQERVCAQEKRPYRPERLLQPEDVAAVVVNALCLPRTAEVTEIKIRPMLKFD
jgi:NADP-dependent 3-hydroxy acid dehydrogenase YdfG